MAKVMECHSAINDYIRLNKFLLSGFAVFPLLALKKQSSMFSEKGLERAKWKNCAQASGANDLQSITKEKPGTSELQPQRNEFW